jgi:hypothetical protein
MLNEALGGDPAGRIGSLYQPRDQNDTRTKNSLINTIKDMSRLTAATRAIRTETVSDGCAWLVEVEFRWLNNFGARRDAKYEMRLHLDTGGGTARIRSVSGAVKK